VSGVIRFAEVLRIMREARAKERPYASYWEWHIEEQAETGITGVLFKFLSDRTGIEVVSIESRGKDDPPDCVARLANGEAIGVEITEIVDKKNG
jgi:hypothetical protein